VALSASKQPPRRTNCWVGIAGALVETLTTDTGAGWVEHGNYTAVNHYQMGYLAGMKIVAATGTSPGRYIHVHDG
jgi:hypothetical protein